MTVVMTTVDDSPATTNMADEEEPQPEVLQPCAVCGRNFNPRSLEKHVRICERTAQRKRKPFDSSKQRIQGTELAEFLPKQHQQQSAPVHYSGTPEPARRGPAAAARQLQHGEAASCRRPNNAWKQTRDEFLRAIRAARGDGVPTAPQQQQRAPQPVQQQHHHQQQGSSQQRPSTLSLVTSPGVPTRSNEKGQCPTCQRQFGVKSYERHVAFCRERATRLPASPQTGSNVAKERLDARMKYRAPALKNRKPTNREKYSPGASKNTITGQSPLMARSSAKEAPVKETGKSEVNSPKLPVLKRPGQTNKESPAASHGPLKSRPIDRSNRTLESQDSLNPPALRQIFASRRLLLLSEVLPSKATHSKVSQSSSSSQKSSARAIVPHFPQREATDSPVESPKSDRKVKKKIRFKTKLVKKPIVPVKEQYEEKQEDEATEKSGRRDFVTWKQIRESTELIESIDKEEEPILSDVTGLSSLEEGNSTNDEFEFNAKASSRRSTKNKVNEHARNSECDSARTSLDQTYQISYPIKLEDLALDNEGSTHTLTNEDKNTAPDSDDNEDGLSTASMKTFRKSDRKAKDDIVIVDTLGLCETEISSAVKEGKGDNIMSLGLIKKTRDRLLSHPKHRLSLPNLGDKKPTGTPRAHKAEESDRGGAINRPVISPKPKSSRTSTPRGDCSNRRCATYVIHEATRNSPATHRDESSEEKPLKKRRKLHLQNNDDEDEGSDGSPSKNESAHRQHQRAVKKASSAENKAEARQQSLVVLDYYRNEAANFSDVSSVRTDDQQMMLDLDDDFADENESNASDLLKEIDVSMVNFDVQGPTLETFVGDSEDSLMELANKLRRMEMMAGRRPKSDARSRRRNVRFDNADESSISTIELTNLTPLSCDGDAKVSTAFEKEICTITRLDRDEPFLPSISDWRDRVEYHREKLVKPSRRPAGIIELETPRDLDDERGRVPEQFPKQQRLCPPMRRLLHLDRRSGLGNDYNPFLLAEQQLNDLFSDTSDQSSTDGSAICLPQKPNSSPNFPISPSSAFVKYPTIPQTDSQQPQTQQQSSNSDKQQRISLIAPPIGFDDLTSSDLSSDCTETNSLSRELLTSSSNSNSLPGSQHQITDREHVLGRRVIIDQSQALGGGEFAPSSGDAKLANGSSRVARPVATVNGCNRSSSMRSASAPKPPERKISSSSSSGSSDFSRNNKNGRGQVNSGSNDQPRGNKNYKILNGSNLSLNSIISSTDLEMKRSNSLFDELLSSFEDDMNSTSTLPSLISLMRNDPSSVSLLSSTPQQNGVNEHHHHHQRGAGNGRINCSDDDAELSSPESVKRQECGGKLSADSAYSSLNRKYSTHGRSTNDVSASNKFKLSKYCYQCGFKFPDLAKFCCECGVPRLTL